MPPVGGIQAVEGCCGGLFNGKRAARDRFAVVSDTGGDDGQFGPHARQDALHPLTGAYDDALDLLRPALPAEMLPRPV